MTNGYYLVELWGARYVEILIARLKSHCAYVALRVGPCRFRSWLLLTGCVHLGT